MRGLGLDIRDRETRARKAVCVVRNMMNRRRSRVPLQHGHPHRSMQTIDSIWTTRRDSVLCEVAAAPARPPVRRGRDGSGACTPGHLVVLQNKITNC